MKVCLLNDSFTPVIDGVVNVLTNYARYLPEDHGSPVIIGTPEYPDTDYGAFPYPVVPYQSFSTEEVTNGYRTGNPLEEKAVSELVRFSPDIIHSHCPASATVIARLMKERTGAPIVFTYHTKYDIDIRRMIKSERAADELIKAMVANIRSCDDIWVVSRGAGESLREIGLDREINYRVMNNGVDFEKGRVGQEDVRKATAGYDLPEGVPVFLFVGRLMNYKNIPLILKALKILSSSGQDFRMVIIGKGPDEESIRETAREYGLLESGKCIFTGPIYDRDVLRAWNTRADLFLFPSTFDTNGLVVREAAACGLASVLIRDSCAAEGVTDGRNGFIIDESAESMAEFLKKACANLDCVHEAGERAMNEIYISWRSCVAEAHERYREVLEMKKEGALPARAMSENEARLDQLVSAIARHMGRKDEARRKRENAWMRLDGIWEHTKERLEETKEKLEEFAGMLDN